MTSERTTPVGTTSIILCRRLAQVVLKVVGSARVFIVTLPSELKTTKSAFCFNATDGPTTRGLWVVPAKYSVTTALSKVAAVESSEDSLLAAVPGGTRRGNSGVWTPPSVCPQATRPIISVAEKPILENWLIKVLIGYT